MTSSRSHFFNGYHNSVRGRPIPCSRAVTEHEATAFSRFLGVPLVSTGTLSQKSDRRDYLAACKNCRSIFLDPDTGIRIKRNEPKRSTEFIFADELTEITKERGNGLVLVFDQSVARGSERQHAQAKLNHFKNQG